MEGFGKMNKLVTKHSDVITKEVQKDIAGRYKTITKIINKEFWNSDSDSAHSFYVGSYGRRTAISTSDIDILVEIPDSEADRFRRSQNIQSRFLQKVKDAIVKTYSRSDVRADGQVIKIHFSDDIKFEIVPAFKESDGTYTYPDTNMGGNWLSSNPKAEIAAMKEKNNMSNGLFNATCRHIRFIRDNEFRSYKLSGIVIDTFVYEAMGGWSYSDGSGNSNPGDYERHLLTSFNQRGGLVLSAPGSKEVIDIASSVECLGKVLAYMNSQ
jgi:predicted nucleotidyltransferase